MDSWKLIDIHPSSVTGDPLRGVELIPVFPVDTYRWFKDEPDWTVGGCRSDPGWGWGQFWHRDANMGSDFLK